MLPRYKIPSKIGGLGGVGKGGTNKEKNLLYE